MRCCSATCASRKIKEEYPQLIAFHYQPFSASLWDVIFDFLNVLINVRSPLYVTAICCCLSNDYASTCLCPVAQITGDNGQQFTTTPPDQTPRRIRDWTCSLCYLAIYWPSSAGATWSLLRNWRKYLWRDRLAPTFVHHGPHPTAFAARCCLVVWQLIRRSQ